MEEKEKAQTLGGEQEHFSHHGRFPPLLQGMHGGGLVLAVLFFEVKEYGQLVLLAHSFGDSNWITLAMAIDMGFGPLFTNIFVL